TTIGNIAQGGAASAQLGDVTTGCLTVGATGCPISMLTFGTFSPSFAEMAHGHVATATWAVPGITTSHYVWVSACGVSGSVMVLAACPLSGSISVTMYNAGSGTVAAAATTCPLAYIAVTA
ncbi:MAG: hypothetical protein KKC55_17950, partial [Gammaproteobacteria bacterium]|nr:hypothetical protein [Gammaproteobacteria bacterium]